jgi:hypothetical protein
MLSSTHTYHRAGAEPDTQHCHELDVTRAHDLQQVEGHEHRETGKQAEHRLPRSDRAIPPGEESIAFIGEDLEYEAQCDAGEHEPVRDASATQVGGHCDDEQASQHAQARLLAQQDLPHVSLPWNFEWGRAKRDPSRCL